MSDLVSVPFNVSCGRCRNCREQHTEVCMTTNPDVACAAYGFNLGGWQGGQADYIRQRVMQHQRIAPNFVLPVTAG